MKLLCYASIISYFIIVITPLAATPVIERIGASLANPWGMDFLDDSHILVTERSGNMYKINLSNGNRHAITGLPPIQAKRQGGLLDVAVLKQDDSSYSVYFCYSKPLAGGSVTAIDRAELEGTSLVKRQTIFVANKISQNAIHYGCRLVLDRKYIYASLGERGERYDAQDAALHAGVIIRLHDDGRIPQDNPKESGWAPEVFSMGHRNPQGMAINPGTGKLWAHEHGPRGGDEINIISAGTNYGWPTISHGKEYIGGTIGIGTSAPGLADPVWVWTPSIAPSGMAFYEGDMFPQLKGHLLVGSLKFQRLYLVHIGNNLPQAEFVILEGAIGRVRDVAVDRDGSILLLSDETDGGLYRLSDTGK